MQFTTYDKTNSRKLDRTKSWINIKYKQIFSAEIKYNKYYQLIKRFEPKYNTTEYFVAFMNNSDEDTKSCRVDDYGRTKFSIADIWKELNLDKLTTDTNINLEYVESIDDVDVFKIGFP